MSDFPNGLTVTGTLSVAGSEVPTLTSTSTLTNKTLTAPVLANPSYSGATANGGTVTTIDINGGTIDGTVIGGTTPAAVSATTLSATDLIRGGSGATYKFSLDYTVAGDIAGELRNSSATGYGYRIVGGTAANYALLVQSQDGTNILNATKGSVAVTGALSASGNITGSASLLLPSATAAIGFGASATEQFYRIGNAIRAYVNGADVATFSSTGLAVTGALSATGPLTSGQLNFNGAGTYEIVNRNGTGIDFYVNAASLKAMELTASGNLGLGVTPSAWGSTYKPMQLGITASVWGRTANEVTGLSSNEYANSGGAATYIASGNFASRYQQSSGNHAWYTAPSGTAGNAITFTQAMMLDASSHLTVTGGITTGSYTVATRPAHAAGRIIHVTDGGAGAVFQGSAGGAWVNLG